MAKAIAFSKRRSARDVYVTNGGTLTHMGESTHGTQSALDPIRNPSSQRLWPGHLPSRATQSDSCPMPRALR